MPKKRKRPQRQESLEPEHSQAVLPPKENAWEFQVDDQNGVDSTLWVRWCLKPAGAAYFKAVGLNPLVLIIVSYPERQDLEQRFLVKVENCMERIWLKRHGQVKIHALLLWDRKLNEKKQRNEDDYEGIWKDTMATRRGQFTNNWISGLSGDLRPMYKMSDYQAIFSSAGEIVENYSFDSFSYSVQVAQEMFAPEPPTWEKNYLNRYRWFDKPEDQCRYRKMRLIAWPLVSLILPFEIIIKWLTAAAILLFGVLWGVYRQDFRSLLRPWKYPIGFVWHKNAGKSISENSFWCKWPHLAAFSPFMMPLYAGIWIKFFDFSSLLWLIVILPLSGAGLVVVAFILFHIVTFAAVRWESFKEYLDKEDEKAAKKPKVIYVATPKFVSIPSAVCAGGLKAEPFTPQILHPRAQTRYLRFIDLKGKMCKPYAQ